MALRAQRISIGLDPAASSYSLKPLIEPDSKVYEEPKLQGEECTVLGFTAALYGDRALSKVGLPYENVEKCSLALPGLLLSLFDDVA